MVEHAPQRPDDLHDGLMHRYFELLTSGFGAPVWLMDGEGQPAMAIRGQIDPCCALFQEQRAECMLFRRELHRAGSKEGHVCTVTCPFGYGFLSMRLPEGGSVDGTLVLGGYRPVGEEAQQTASGPPGIHLGIQSAAIGALPAVASLLKEALTGRLVNLHLDRAAHFCGHELGRVDQAGLSQATDLIARLAALSPAVDVLAYLVTGDSSARIMSVHGPTVKDHLGTELPLGMSMLNWVVRTGRDLLVPDVSADPRAHQAVHMHRLKPKSWYLVPLRVQGEVMGVLAVGWPGTGAPPEAELVYIRTVSAMLGEIWTHARLNDRVAQYDRSITVIDQFLQETRALPVAVEFLLSLFATTFALARAELCDEKSPRITTATINLAGRKGTTVVGLPLSGRAVRLELTEQSVSRWSDAAARIWLYLVDVGLTIASNRQDRQSSLRQAVTALLELVGRLDPERRRFCEQAAQQVSRLIPILPGGEETGAPILQAAFLMELGAVLGRSDDGLDLLPANSVWTPVLTALRYQRERWNGSGPHRLPGHEIPLGGRVLGVVRRYLELKGRTDGGLCAMHELEQEAGVLWDPTLVHMILYGTPPPGAGAAPLGTAAARPAETPPRMGEGERHDRFHLTGRELEILERMAKGYSNREIAQELYVTEATVKTHVSRILRKLGVERRSKAVRIYQELIFQ